MLWLNAQRSFWPLSVDEAQGSNRSKTNSMRGTPTERERQTRLNSTIDSSIQVYHPVFSTDNYNSSVSLELALQTVFDHAKLKPPNTIAKRVTEHWQFHGHDNNYTTNHPVTAGSIYTVFHTATQEIYSPRGCRAERPSVPDTLESRCAHIEESKMKGGCSLCTVYNE